MDHILLHVYLLTESDRLATIFLNAPTPQAISLSVKTVSAGEPVPDLAGVQDVLLVSDDAQRLAPYGEIAREDFHMILLADGLEKFPAGVSDVWPRGESDEMLSHRIELLLGGLGDHFEAWLYKTYLMATIDSMPDLVWYKDKAGLHWLVNNRFEDTVHKTREMIHGREHDYIWDVPPEDQGQSSFRCLESEREVMAKKATCVSDEHVKTSDGMRHFLTFKSPLYGRDGDVMGTVGIGHDVTDLNNAGIEIKMLLENLPFSIVVCDAERKGLQGNSKFRKEFGITKEQVEGFDYSAWKAAHFQPLGELTTDRENHCQFQEFTTQVNGKEQTFQLVEQQILDYFGNVTGYYCIFRDITLEKEYQKMILQYANTDPLTGMYNRRYFFQKVREHSGEPAALLFMDMDNFKKINDTYGHAAGDAVLTEVATRLRKAFPNALTARFGGDEYAVAILGDIDPEKIQATADKLTRDVEDTYRYMGLNISLSIGISFGQTGVKDMDRFLHEGDDLMYQAKQRKKDVRC